MVKFDYNVLFLFFNNLERTKQSFEAIRNAKPKKLFLFQDGPRNAKENEEVLKVRKFVEEAIDWECDIYKSYHDKNLGCDPSEYLAQKWAFSFVDKCIILEDDDVACPSFFRFCWEMLLKYENDKRIGIICGMNNLSEYPKNYEYDYFFSRTGCIWGWATWKRVIDLWDPIYSWLDDKNALCIIQNYFNNKKDYKNFIDLCEQRRNSGIEYYETILGVCGILNNFLNIVPTKNLISNIGYSGGVHSFNELSNLPKNIRDVYNKPTYELGDLIKDPIYINNDFEYENLVAKQLHVSFIKKIYYFVKRKIKRR